MEKRKGLLREKDDGCKNVQIEDFVENAFFDICIMGRNSKWEFTRTRKGFCFKLDYTEEFESLMISLIRRGLACKSTSATGDEETSDGGNVESAGKDGKAVEANNEANGELFGGR